jgi:hypothetical protein
MEEIKYTILYCVFVRTFVITCYYGSWFHKANSYGSGSGSGSTTLKKEIKIKLLISSFFVIFQFSSDKEYKQHLHNEHRYLCMKYFLEV